MTVDETITNSLLGEYIVDLNTSAAAAHERREEFGEKRVAVEINAGGSLFK